MADLFRANPVIVQAIQLRDVGADQWDEVAEFLGLDPNSGRGEHATMRRPRQYQPGFVVVTLHPTTGVKQIEQTTVVDCDDWLVRDSAGRYSGHQSGPFADLFAAIDVESDARDLYSRSSLARETNGWESLTEADRNHFRQRVQGEDAMPMSKGN